MGRFLINSTSIIQDIVQFLLEELRGCKIMEVSKRLLHIRHHKMIQNYPRARLVLTSSQCTGKFRYPKSVLSALKINLIGSIRNCCSEVPKPKVQTLPTSNGPLNLQSLVNEVEIETQVFSEMMHSKPEESKKNISEELIKLIPEEPIPNPPSTKSSTSSFYSCNSDIIENSNQPPILPATVIPIRLKPLPKIPTLSQVQESAKKLNKPIKPKERPLQEVPKTETPKTVIKAPIINTPIESYVKPKRVIDLAKNPILVERQQRLDYIRKTLLHSRKVQSDPISEIKSMPSVLNNPPKKSSLLTMARTQSAIEKPKTKRIEKKETPFNWQRLSNSGCLAFTQAKLKTKALGVRNLNTSPKNSWANFNPVVGRRFCDMQPKFLENDLLPEIESHRTAGSMDLTNLDEQISKESNSTKNEVEESVMENESIGIDDNVVSKDPVFDSFRGVYTKQVLCPNSTDDMTRLMDYTKQTENDNFKLKIKEMVDKTNQDKGK